MSAMWDSFDEWRKARSRQACRVLMFGPSQSGKTSLLSAMALAAAQTEVHPNGLNCRLRPANPEMVRLDLEGRTSIMDGVLPSKASEYVTQYQFSFESEYPGVLTRTFFGNTKRLSFQIIDGPGGSLLPAIAAARHFNHDLSSDPKFQELVGWARQADSLVLCVDSNNTEMAASFFSFLPLVFQALGKFPLPYESLVILLTKADDYFAADQEQAAHRARETDPWQRVIELLTLAGTGSMLASIDRRRTELVAAWTSSYGFLPSGCANFEPQEGRMRGLDGLSLADRYWRSWQPFQVLEPLIYLTTREPGNLWFLRHPHPISRTRP